MELKIIAAKKGFDSTSVGITYLMELRQWILNTYGLYVQEQCFNTFNWGVRVYKLTDSEDVGAPIMMESEPKHGNNILALHYGLLMAIDFLD